MQQGESLECVEAGVGCVSSKMQRVQRVCCLSHLLEMPKSGNLGRPRAHDVTAGCVGCAYYIEGSPKQEVLQCFEMYTLAGIGGN